MHQQQSTANRIPSIGSTYEYVDPQKNYKRGRRQKESGGQNKNAMRMEKREMVLINITLCLLLQRRAKGPGRLLVQMEAIPFGPQQDEHKNNTKQKHMRLQ